jgi:hypothetical protein
MEMLKAHNWMPWKRWMMAVLRDLGLEKYIAKDEKTPGSANPQNPTMEELEATWKWAKGDAKASTLPSLGYSIWNPWNVRWNPWNVRWNPWNFQVDSIPFSGGFHGMVDGFHIFSRWIPYHFQGGVHMESM